MKQTKTTKLEVRLTPEEKEKLVRYAEARKITMSQAIRQLCQKIFKEDN